MKIMEKKAGGQTVVNRCLALIVLLLFCQSIVVTPAWAYSLGDERKAGQELLYTIRKYVKLVDAPDVQQYFRKLGAEVLKVADGRHFTYRFFIINDKEFNAFAAPSGLIFFNTGLIDVVQSEDELVSVLAHEVGHAVSRHIASRIEKGTVVNFATLGLALAALALGGGEASQALFMGSLAAGKSFQLSFSRHDEEEADRLAYEWMKEMKRDPREMESMLKSMRRITRYRMGKTIPQYLLTHPNPEVRLDYVQSLLVRDRESLGKGAVTDQFDFLRMKYRVLTTVLDSEKMRNSMAIKVADSRSSPFEVIMAKYGLSQLARLENNFVRGNILLDEVLAFFPDRPILLADKGVMEYEAGHLDRAIELLETARKKQHNDLYATFTLAGIYSDRQDFVKAERYLNRVAVELPEYPKVYFELGKLKSRQGKRGDSHYYLGKFNLYEGRMKLAKANLHKAVAIRTTTEKLKEEAAELLESLKDMKKNDD